MTNYNYLEAMQADIREAIRFDYDLTEWTENRQGLEEKLNDELWTDDSVTGNGSGSYTFNRAKAREYVLADMDLCIEALREFCVEPETIAEKFLAEDWEYFDVTARCYLLGQAISAVLDDMEESGAFDAEEVEEEDESEEKAA